MFESKINRGRANGYAPLDSEGKVPLDKTYVGTNGTSGTSGGTGISGTSGTSGESGSSGTSGGTGIAGTSGTSGSSILLDSNLSFTNNTIQGNNLNTAGTIISISQSFDARTDLIGNGVNVINNSESSQVQIGWIVRFYDGTVRTVVASYVPVGQSYRVIQVNQNVSLSPAYPLTIESPDYSIGDDPFVEIKAGTSGWTFGMDGSLTLPNGDVIMNAPGNGSSGTSGGAGPSGTNGTSGTSGINGLDSSLSLKWELQDTAGANPTGSSYFSACCNSGLANTGSFKFAYTSSTVTSEGFWNILAFAIANGSTPYLQITQVSDPNVVGLYEITGVTYSDPANGGQYAITTNGVPAIYGSGLWSIGEEYSVSFSLAGASGSSGSSGSAGTSGFSGSTGTSGSSGTSGSTGTSGSSGTSGVSGAAGSSGTSGVSGAAGSSGTSGTSGYVDNDWLFFTPSTATIPSSGNNFVLSGTTTSNGSVSYNQSTGIITLAANKTYKLDASLALANSVNNSEINYQWINVTAGNTAIGNAGAVLVNSSTAQAAWQSMASAIIVTTGTTQVALRAGFSNSTGGLNTSMCRYIVNQINGWSGTSGTSGSAGTSGSSLSILNNSDNRITTATGNTGELNAESLLTFDGSKLSVLTQSGDEGGEINLAVPVTNTTLSTRVVVDIWRDRFRIFDGNTNGVFVDLSKAPAGVAGEITWKTSGFVNAGTFLTLDNLKVTCTTSGNRGLSVGAVSTNFTANIAGWFGFSGGGGGGSANNVTYTTTAASSAFSWGFNTEGDTSNYIITDKTNNRVYRVTLMIGPGFNNNFILIERLH